MRKYAELVMEWLRDLGYTHCFFVAGGNSMHLLDGARQTMTCVPVVHEVAAGIAAEYFNESGASGRAFVLVTAGPGMTNLVTALAGAHLESRELLVLGGQVKSTDLANGLRQRGIQEIDGVAIARPVTVLSERIEAPIDRGAFVALAEAGSVRRKGPVFLEFCLDAQGAPVDETTLATTAALTADFAAEHADDSDSIAEQISRLVRASSRPVLLLGGGVSRVTASKIRPALTTFGVPVMTTWNGADRIGADHPLYFGRPNTWGQRYANVLIQQADLVVALGTRLGLQQTGFNWQSFVPNGTIVQVDIDRAELEKGHPRVAHPFVGDANPVLEKLVEHEVGAFRDWIGFCEEVKSLLPVAEPENETADGYLDPYRFLLGLSERFTADDIIVPCSSGGAFTVTMQALLQKEGQVVITDKGLASMGYGLSGAIGCAIAHPTRRTILIEGDGGFAQNLQEIATVAVNTLPLKIFVFANEGYASIRMTQRNYFGGQYLGCDTRTGLGFPEWPALFGAFGIPAVELDEHGLVGAAADLFDRPGPAAFVVPIDPEQTYFPKITSRVTATGSMESNPLHLMSPDLPSALASKVFRYIDVPAPEESA